MFFVQTTMHAAKISLKAKLLFSSAVHYLTSSEYWVQDGRKRYQGYLHASRKTLGIEGMVNQPTGYFPLSSFEV
jgi:hypothetical protein